MLHLLRQRRGDAEIAMLDLAERDVRASVVRIPPITHSTLDRHGFARTLIAIARQTGVAGYPGDGANQWPAGHTLDVGHLYRLALENAPAGSTLHGVGDTGIPRKVIAETIARELRAEAKSITEEEAPQYLGFLAAFAGFDNPTSNDKTARCWAGSRPTPAGSRTWRPATTSLSRRRSVPGRHGGWFIA